MEKRRQKLSFISLLVLIFTILASFLHFSSVNALNRTFKPFDRNDYPDYLSSNEEIAKEVAYYIHYIAPFIANRKDGCLGSRQYDHDSRESAVRGDDKNQAIFHINRCSQLHASDLARLSYIMALNANLDVDEDGDKNTYFRFLLKNIEIKNKITSELKSTSEGERLLGEAFKNSNPDNDGIYLRSISELESNYSFETVVKASKILPTASSEKISSSNMRDFFIPNISLKNSDNSSLFGLSKFASTTTFMPELYHNMFYNSVNYALRDCGEYTANELNVANDPVANNRAILLNPVKTQDKYQDFSEGAKKCQTECNKVYDDFTKMTKECNETNTKQIIINAIEDLCNDGGCAKGYNTSSLAETLLNSSVYGMKFKDFVISSLRTDTLFREEESPRLSIKPNLQSLYGSLRSSGANSGSDRNENFVPYEEYTGGGFDAFYNKITVNLFGSISDGGREGLYANCAKESAANVNIPSLGSTQSEDNHNNMTSFDRQALLESGEKAKSCNNICDKYKIQPIQKPSCGTLVRIMYQLDHPDEVLKSLGSYNSTPKWLPLTDDEKKIMNFGDSKILKDDKDITEWTYEPDLIEKSTCPFYGWASFMCTITNFLGRLADSSFLLAESMLIFPTEVLHQDNGNKNYNLYAVWSTFRDIANAILIIMFLLVIVSQAIGWKIDQFGVKRNLPKLIIAGILINLSFFICQVVIDFSHIIGHGSQDLLKTISKNVTRDAIINNTNLQIVSGGNIFSTILPVVFAFTSIVLVIVNLAVLAPSIVGMLATMFGVVLILVFRQVAIVMLIMLSPVAFALGATNATETFTKRWWKILWAIFVVYPIVGFTAGLGNLMYTIVNFGAKPYDTLRFLSPLLLFIPLLTLPKTLKSSIDSLPLIGSKLSGSLDNFAKSAENRVAKTKLVQTATKNRDLNQVRDKMGLSRPGKTHPIRSARSSFNRLLNKAPFYKNRPYMTGAFGDEAAEWVKERENGMYKDINGNQLSNPAEQSTELVRDYNTNASNSAKSAEHAASMLLTMADNGEGYFEDVLVSLNKLSSVVDQNNLMELTKNLVEKFQDNGRYDISAMIEELGIRTANTFQVSSSQNAEDVIDSFNSSITGTATPNDASVINSQREIIKKHLNRYSGSMKLHKFKGFDDQATASRIRVSYSNKILSSEAARQGFIESWKNSGPGNTGPGNTPAFRESVNRSHKTKSYQNFLNRNGLS